MKNVNVTEVRDNLGDLLSQVTKKHERFTVTQHGKPVAVLVSVEDGEALEEIEERIDTLEARKALKQMADRGEKPIAWSKVKKELSL